MIVHRDEPIRLRRVLILLAGAIIGLTAPGAGYAQTCFSDAFLYGDGNLAGNENWTGGAGRILLETGQIKLDFSTGDATGNSSASFPVSCPICPTDGTITVTIYMKQIGTNTNQGNNYSIEFSGYSDPNKIYPISDTDLQPMARWYGTATTAVPRVGNNLGPAVTLTSTYVKLQAVISPALRKTDFYHDGIGPDTVNWPAPNDSQLHGFGYPETISSVTIVDNNIAGRTGVLYLDDFSIQRCPSTCVWNLTPWHSDFITENFLSVAEPNGPGFPPSFTFDLLNNTATNSVDYTVSKVKPDGTTTTAYDSWLSVSPTSGSVASFATAAPPITASITAPAAPGIYAAAIKVADSCSTVGEQIRPVVLTVGSAPCFVDPFQYPLGDLGSNGGWTGGHGKIKVITDPADANNLNGVVKVIADAAGGGGGATATINLGGCPPCEDGTFIVSARVKGAASNGNNSWEMGFLDSAGNELARWFGTSSAVQPRIRGSLLPSVNLTLGDFDELSAVVNVVTNRTEFFHTPAGGSQTLLGTLSHGADVAGQNNVGDRVTSVYISRIGRGVGDGATGDPIVDDIQVISCAGDCLGRVSPDVSQNDYTDLPHAKSGASITTTNDGLTQYFKDYIFHNDGPASISYAVEEVDANGAPTNYPWMSLSKPGAGPITGGTEDAPVTITYDTTGLADDLYRGYIKFTDNCNSERTYTRAIQLNVGQCLADDFAYSDGSLESQPGWRTGFLNQLAAVPQRPSGADPVPIQVVGGKVVVRGKPASGTIEATHQRFNNCTDCVDTDAVTPDLQGDGLIVVRVRVKGTTDGGGSRFWYLEFTNNTGVILASWRGAATFAEGHSNAALSSCLNGQSPPCNSDGLYHELRAVINPNTTTVEGIPGNTTKYLLDGVPVGADGLASHVNTSVNRIQLIRLRRDDNANADTDPMIELDDLSISDCGPICGDPIFDTHDASNQTVRDGFVDAHDLEFGFKPCVTGPTPGDAVFEALSFECKCLDLNQDKAIDINDFARFQRCYSGPSTPASVGCDD